MHIECYKYIIHTGLLYVAVGLASKAKVCHIRDTGTSDKGKGSSRKGSSKKGNLSFNNLFEG